MPALTNKLAPGEKIYAGQFMISANGKYVLAVDAHTNALYDISGPQKQLVWGGVDPNANISALEMQADGNLVLKDAQGRDVWHTGTFQGGPDYGYHTIKGPGNYLRLQDDGNLVIYNKEGKAVWDRSATTGPGGIAGRGTFLGTVADALSAAPGSFVDFTQSPAWQVIASAAVFIPGVGVAVSAGMEAAYVAGKVIKGKTDILSAAAEGLSIADASGVINTEAVQSGFNAAVGVLVQNPTAGSIKLAFDQLSGDPAAQAGFNAAAAIFKGAASGQAPPDVQNAAAKAGYYAQAGVVDQPPNSPAAKAVTPIVQMSPAAKAGALTAAQNLRSLASSAQAVQATQALRGLAASSQPSPSSLRPMGFFEWLVSEVKAGVRFVTGR